MKKAILRRKGTRAILIQYETNKIVLEVYLRPSHTIPDFVVRCHNKDFDIAIIEMIKRGSELVYANDEANLLRFHNLNINELV